MDEEQLRDEGASSLLPSPVFGTPVRFQIPLQRKTNSRPGLECSFFDEGS
jgi:hypothetical protein